MKKYFILFGLFLCVTKLSAQDFNSDKTALSNFVRRMYESTKFEGVKIVEDYNSKYIVSLVVLEKAKYTSSSTIILPSFSITFWRVLKIKRPL